MSLFVDTSIWYAAADSSDRSNVRSKAILKSGETLVTSEHVLVETWTSLHLKLDRKAAERFWEGLRSGIAASETVTLADLEIAWDIGFSWRDHDFSIVDRTSFAIMRRLGIDRVASFRAKTPRILSCPWMNNSLGLESRMLISETTELPKTPDNR